MRKMLPWIASLVGAGALAAQPAFETTALLADRSGAPTEIHLLSATGKTLRYRIGASKEVTEGPIPDGGTLFIPEPPDFSEAMDLYQARKFTEAKARFVAVKQHFSPVRALKNNPAALAAFYELECLRKLGDLDGLAAALQGFSKDALTDETQLRQMELYLLWDAVRAKNWELAERLANERAKTRLPGEQRAQVAWCHGLAVENLGRPREALFLYQTAMTADAGASIEIARQAALRVLAIHKADPTVQAAIKAWGTKEENKTTQGRADLLEAAAVARLFELALGGGTPLPAEHKNLPAFKDGE